ncbi:unnamed protein product [Dovyalis caffra]|uniref:Uncharacterized protein n=1 Tax=Dovyalis caffra TaxID=77055 RepID=A0AAV1S3Z4_9ROSI|nr:unnamed protein product [Dovyalis caffra]
MAALTIVINPIPLGINKGTDHTTRLGRIKEGESARQARPKEAQRAESSLDPKGVMMIGSGLLIMRETLWQIERPPALPLVAAFVTMDVVGAREPADLHDMTQLEDGVV